MKKDCETCKNAIFIIGFEKDPICNINDGIECGRKETWRSWEFNNNKVNFKKGGIGEMFNQIDLALNNEREDI